MAESLPNVVHYGGFWPRLGSMIIDGILMMALVLPVVLYVRNSPAQLLLGAIFAFAVLTLYDVYSLKRWGKTLGKHTVGLKVTTLDFKPLTWKHAILRHSFDILFQLVSLATTFYIFSKVGQEFYSASMNGQAEIESKITNGWIETQSKVSNVWIYSELLVLLTNEKRRSLHDFIAGTVVIRQRVHSLK
jgi:uncharacterized RDD family membrane protein YckC